MAGSALRGHVRLEIHAGLLRVRVRVRVGLGIHAGWLRTPRLRTPLLGLGLRLGLGFGLALGLGSGLGLGSAPLTRPPAPPRGALPLPRRARRAPASLRRS